MIAIDFYKDKQVGVLGLGRTGCATIDALSAGGAQVIAWDDSKEVRRQQRPHTAPFKLFPPDHEDWCGIDLLVPSPGIDERHDLIRQARLLKTEITGDVELFGRAARALPPMQRPPLIAITGTNGKSTVTKLVAHILQIAGYDVQLGGNIGIPVLALAPLKASRIYVLEVSSYQANHLQKFTPSIAVQLNVSPDHTDRHGSLENYAAAKARLFSQLGKNGVAIISTEDVFGRKLVAQLKAKARRPKIIRLPEDIALTKAVRGQSRQNAAAAWAVARAMNVSESLFKTALDSFTPLAHRREEIAQIGAVRYINDSKATNAEAACEALGAYRDIYWLAGGAAKAEGFEALRRRLRFVRHAYLFGAARDVLGDFLGDRLAWTKYETLREAVHHAGEDAQKEGQKAGRGVVLLSPACASFDAFTDFTARGRAFGTYVREQSSRGVVFMAAGGTGGGLFPAESLAQELRHRGFQCILMTDRRVLPLIDRTLWDRVYHISSAPIAGRAPRARLAAVFWIGLGALQSLWILLWTLLVLRAPVKVVMGFGGYPSLPPLLAAILLRMKILIHEPGAALGRANRLMMKFARGVATSFPLKEKRQKKFTASLQWTGNPVRSDIGRLSGLPYLLPNTKEPFLLMIFAGSQGAKVFDEIVPQALSLVAHTGRKIRIMQQFRPDSRAHRDQVLAIYRKASIDVELAPFFDDLPLRMAQAHLVIARAGASTISELAVLGRPAILVPITGAVAHEQMANARSFAASGAAWVIAEEELTPETLARQIESLIDADHNFAALTGAAKAARAQAKKMRALDAAARLADFVEGCL